ncbi:Alpha/Beta hydrolase protein [Rhypophila decipiens]
MARIPFVVPFLFWAAASTATVLGPPKSKCSNLSFKLPITHDSLVITSPPDPNNETQNARYVKATLGGAQVEVSGTQVVSGTFTINAIYCRPHPASHRRHPNREALQILVHGITYNKDMWSGLGLDDQYNWHAAANAEGYHTLAIDRVGHGPGAKTAYNGQSFPDPLLIVQSDFHVESIFQLINTIRDNTQRNVIKKKFDKIIYVGHSYGSFIGAALARLHPSSLNALILTGYSTSINLNTANVLSFVSPATLFPQNPSRFPHSQPKGYQAISTLSARKEVYFSGSYDPAIPPLDFAYLTDTITTGESATLIRTASVPVTGYTGPVMIVTGEDDYIFCHTVGKTCEEIMQDTLAGFFPDIEDSNKGYFVPPRTGHCLTLHYSVGETTREVARLLERFF